MRRHRRIGIVGIVAVLCWCRCGASAATSPVGPSPRRRPSRAGSAAAGDGTVDESVDGAGAAAWAAAIAAAEASPLAADDSLEPFVIGLPNLEGDPAGTFPDVGEGAEAAVQFINEKLGGIGADLEAGVAGRPIELVYCGHLVDQNEAQACANQVADANPNMVMIGVDFFTPLMYPLFADFPVVETLPIFIADFDQPGVVSPFGGCPTAFPSSAQMIAEIKGHDRLAVIWDENAPGTECWQDTQERFYQYYADTLENFEFQGFPYTPGETAGQPAVVQQVADYLDGAENPAVYFGISAAECARLHPGPGRRRRRSPDLHRRLVHQRRGQGPARERRRDLRAAGLPARPARARTATSSPPSWRHARRRSTTSARRRRSRATPARRSPASCSSTRWPTSCWPSGGDIDDREALRAAYAAVDDFHIVGYRPISCADNPPEYESVCAHTATYAAWDGSTFTVGRGDPGRGDRRDGSDAGRRGGVSRGG